MEVEIAVEQDFASSGALSATLASTALIGRQLLSAPTVVNAIANQSVFANALFNLQIDLGQVFNYYRKFDGYPLFAGRWCAIARLVDKRLLSLRLSLEV